MQLTLDRLPIGQTDFVSRLAFQGNERRRMMDLGIVKGTTIEAVQKSPSGDPIAYFIRGTVIALRDEDARKIIIH